MLGDGECPTFAYTVGLHDYGMPELLMSSRHDKWPTEDADWVLHPQDVAGAVNEFGRRMLCGDFLATPETEWAEPADGGLTEVLYRLEPFVAEDDDVLPLQADPLAAVLRVRFTIRHLPGAGM